MKTNKGITLIEMTIVLLIFSLISFFLYELFSKANRITSQSDDLLFVYQDQTALYSALLEDLEHSFVYPGKGLELSDTQRLDNLQSYFVVEPERLSFLISRGPSALFLQEGDGLSINRGRWPSEPEIYRVQYRVLADQIRRELFIPVSSDPLYADPENWQALFPDIYNIDPQSYAHMVPQRFVSPKKNVFLNEALFSSIGSGVIPEKISIRLRVSSSSGEDQDHHFAHVLRVR